MEPYEQGTSSTDEEDVDDKVVVDGDLLQEDLSTWMGTTCRWSQCVLHTQSRDRSLLVFGS